MGMPIIAQVMDGAGSSPLFEDFSEEGQQARVIKNSAQLAQM
jgi:hypothetical protein